MKIRYKIHARRPYSSISSVVFLCCMLSFALCGCAHSELDDCSGGGPSASNDVYVKLNLSMRSSSPSLRSNPTGGEDGDGTEVGQDYENAVSTAHVFFFAQTDAHSGANRTDNPDLATMMTFSTFYASNTNTSYESSVEKTSLPIGKYDAYVVVNDVTTDWSGIKSLNDLLEHVRKESAWRTSGNNFSHFVMASAKDASMDVSINTVDNPTVLEVSVERHAARVDYQTENVYACTDSRYSGATVEILGAAILNNLVAGCYTLKRVTDPTDESQLLYLGNETSLAGVATNYVRDPWFIDKNGNNDLSYLYGIPYRYSENADDWNALVKDGTVISTETDDETGNALVWKRAGYTLENTMHREHTDKKYTTGMVFKARFTPQGVDGYTAGETFFVWGTQIYIDLEQVMDAFLKVYSSNNTLSSLNSSLDACSSWMDISNYINSLPEGDPFRYKTILREKYVENQNQSFTDDIKSSYYWSAFMSETYGYGKTQEGKVAVDGNGKNTRLLLDPYGIRVYKDAICYYTWWIRHSNDGQDNVNGVMEYAIVRNNIYKLSVESVYSLGTPIPEEENINIRVYVKNWALLSEETLEM